LGGSYFDSGAVRWYLTKRSKQEVGVNAPAKKTRYLEDPPTQEFDPAFIQSCIRDAQPTVSDNGPDVEAKRIAATNYLVKIYRNQLKSHSVRPELQIFIESINRRIWTSDDPITELTKILRPKNKVGAKKLPDDRDLDLAMRVKVLMTERKTRDEACVIIGDEIGRSADVVRNAYQRVRTQRPKEFKAAWAMYKIERS
jgi:hypothetical protein